MPLKKLFCRKFLPFRFDSTCVTGEYHQLVFEVDVVGEAYPLLCLVPRLVLKSSFDAVADLHGKRVVYFVESVQFCQYLVLPGFLPVSSVTPANRSSMKVVEKRLSEFV
jgi:hypothetical protein